MQAVNGLLRLSEEILHLLMKGAEIAQDFVSVLLHLDDRGDVRVGGLGRGMEVDDAGGALGVERM